MCQLRSVGSSFTAVPVLPALLLPSGGSRGSFGSTPLFASTPPHILQKQLPSNVE